LWGCTRTRYLWLEDAHDKAMKPSVQQFNKCVGILVFKTRSG
jgi:hypothetical protein